MLNTLRFLSNRLQISLVCFGVIEAREAISGDVQLARRFGELTLNRWAANEQFEALVSSIQRLPRPTIARPILPIGLRMALLAGISIVYQEGPTLLSELKRQTLGAHYTRFTAIGADMSVSSNSHPLQLN